MFSKLRMAWWSPEIIKSLGLEDEVTRSSALEVPVVVRYKGGREVRVGAKSLLSKEVNEAADRAGVVTEWTDTRAITTWRGLLRTSTKTGKISEFTAGDVYIFFGQISDGEFLPTKTLQRTLPHTKQKTVLAELNPEVFGTRIPLNVSSVRELWPTPIHVGLRGTVEDVFLFARLSSKTKGFELQPLAVFHDDSAKRLVLSGSAIEDGQEFWRDSPGNRVRNLVAINLEHIHRAYQTELDANRDGLRAMRPDITDDETKSWDYFFKELGPQVQTLGERMSNSAAFRETEVNEAIVRTARLAIIERFSSWHFFARQHNLHFLWPWHRSFETASGNAPFFSMGYWNTVWQIATGETGPFIRVDIFSSLGGRKHLRANMPESVVRSNDLLTDKIPIGPIPFGDPGQATPASVVFARYVIPFEVGSLGAARVDLDPFSFDKWGVA